MKREGKMIVRRVAVTLLLAVLTATTAMADDMTWAQLKAACSRSNNFWD